MTRLRPGIGTATLLATALLLAACSGSEDGGQPTDAAESTDVSATSAEAQPSVKPVTATSLASRTKDPGLDAEWIYQGVRPGFTGGSVVTFLVHNTGDKAIDPADIPPATLTYNSGGTTVTAEPQASTDPEIVYGLDLPLGAGAATNVRYAFTVAPGNLWDARLQVGNVIWEGNLSY